jgi:hypothetical protein
VVQQGVGVVAEELGDLVGGQRLGHGGSPRWTRAIEVAGTLPRVAAPTSRRHP